MAEHFEFELHVFVIFGAGDFYLLRGDPEVVEDRVVDDSRNQVKTPRVVEEGFGVSSVVFGFNGGLAAVLLLVFDGLLHDDLVLARYVVKLEHEFFRERVVSLTIRIDT